MNTNEKGFTLIELMTVVAIICILGAVSAANVISQLPVRNLERSARDMASNLRKARAKAIKLNRPVIVEFDVSDDAYRVDVSGANTKYAFPSTGIRYGFPGRSDPISFPGDKIIFNTRGMTNIGAQAFYAYVQNSKGQGYRIGVRGMAANTVMERCGSSDSSGAVITCLE